MTAPRTCGAAGVRWVWIEEAIDGTFMVIVNGYQWGDDPAQFDFRLGCSSQTWETEAEAQQAVSDAGLLPSAPSPSPAHVCGRDC